MEGNVDGDTRGSVGLAIRGLVSGIGLIALLVLSHLAG